MSMVRQENEPHVLWNILAFLPLGLASLAYVIYKRDFAELHVQIPSLGFPIFIGEIVSFWLFILFIGYGIATRGRVRWWHGAFLAYFIWMLVKVFLGLWHWGPLALRHAAIFYQPFFLVVGYVFYRRQIFNPKVVIGLFLSILAVLSLTPFDGYWTLTLGCLAGILILKVPNRYRALAMFAALALVFPYSFLFNTSRMMFVANVIALVFLLFGWFALSSWRIFYKIAVVSLCGALVLGAYYIYFFKGQSGRTFSSFQNIVQTFSAFDKVVQEKKSSFKMQFLDVKLYHPEIKPPATLPVERTATAGVVDFLKKALEEVKASFVGHEFSQGGAQQGGISKKSSFKIQSLDGKLDHSEIKPPLIALPPERPAPARVVVPLVKAREEVKAPLTGQGASPGGTHIPEKSTPVVTATSIVSAGEAAGAQERTLIRSISKIGIFKGLSEHQFLKDPEQVAGVSVNNIVFRLFIWRDMVQEWLAYRPIFGFDFGRPLRSYSLEILRWGSGEWSRDGWIEPHNSYLNILYRSGVVGILSIGLIIGNLVRLIIFAFKKRSWEMLFLSAILLNWMVAANFLLIFELPYTAIPFWTLFGITLGYRRQFKGAYAGKG